MKTKITVLCENSVSTPLPFIAEHGLSILIEQDDITLYDTGQGLGIINNCTLLAKKSDSFARIILSHGHYDHTGGLAAVLESRAEKIPVYLHPEAFNDKKAVIPIPGNILEVPIGMRQAKNFYENAGAEFKFINGFHAVTAAISALSEVRRPKDWKTWDTRLKVKKDNALIDDPFNDDLSLIINTESGPVVILGCAHAGIVEILDDLSDKTGHTEFHAILGGTHLESAPDEYVDRTIDTLKKYRIKKVGVSHCTGFARASRVFNEFKNEFASASVGASFEF